jgi:hypothetical protein
MVRRCGSTIEHLLCKCKDWSSNPSPTHKKKKKMSKREVGGLEVNRKPQTGQEDSKQSVLVIVYLLVIHWDKP